MPPTDAPGTKRHGYIDTLIMWREPKLSAAVLAGGLVCVCGGGVVLHFACMHAAH